MHASVHKPFPPQRSSLLALLPQPATQTRGSVHVCVRACVFARVRMYACVCARVHVCMLECVRARVFALNLQLHPCFILCFA